MPHKKGTDRNQLYLLPPSLEDFITEDNPVRIIEAFVNTLDFEKLQFKKVRTKERGCRPYHPGNLLKFTFMVIPTGSGHPASLNGNVSAM